MCPADAGPTNARRRSIRNRPLEGGRRDVRRAEAGPVLDSAVLAMTKPRLDPKSVLERYGRARQRRAAWEAHWQECYDFALPQRDGIIRQGRPGEKKTEKLFDATAPDAVDQLAASLMAQLTPPWSTWFGFSAGPDADAALRNVLAPDLERMSRIVQAHFDRSNFVVELHQCYLDLVTAGTACLMFEETATGDESAFRFTAVPLSQVVLEEGASGRTRHDLSPEPADTGACARPLSQRP